MKRFWLAVGVGVLAWTCGMPSGVTTPTVSSEHASRAVSGVSCPSPSPPTLPFATFGNGATQGAASAGTEQCGTTPGQIHAVFKIHPDPASGFSPLTVNFGMCGSSDSDPSISLHYKVIHGDGSPDDGAQNSCSFSYTYPNPGTYTATECVWDEIPAHAPGICQSFPVTVTPSCSVTFSNVHYCFDGVNWSLAAFTATQGVSTCGLPLNVGAFENGNLSASRSIKCPPGAQPSISGVPAAGGYLILAFTLIPTECVVDIGTLPEPPGGPVAVVLQGLNATGSTIVEPGTGCGG
jgi:hypothetical protein